MIKKVRRLILFSGDVFFAYLSLLLTVSIGLFSELSLKTLRLHLYPFSLLYLSWLIVFYIFDLYNLHVSRDKFLFYPRLFEALAVNFVIGIAFFYLWPAFGITPKTNLLLNIVFFGALMALWRKVFYRLFSKRLLSNIAVLGESKQANVLVKEIKKRPYLGYSLTSINQRDGLLDEIKKKNIEVLVVAEEIKNHSPLLEVLYGCLEAKINFLNLPAAYELITKKIPVSFVSKQWLLENLREGKKVFYDKLKRIFDLLISLIILSLTSPLWALIALAIKLGDKGSVFYQQKRVGKDRRVFKLIKFRSMKKEAEKNGAVWAEKNDPRITRVGRLLRRTHLDELPQMLNVLKGELSLVGPRPERPEFVKNLERQIPHYHLRHLIKPGITGWDQIKFKYARTVEESFEKFEYDLYYLKNRNLLLDIAIALKTLQMLFRNTG